MLAIEVDSRKGSLLILRAWMGTFTTGEPLHRGWGEIRMNRTIEQSLGQALDELLSTYEGGKREMFGNCDHAEVRMGKRRWKMCVCGDFEEIDNG